MAPDALFHSNKALKHCGELLSSAMENRRVYSYFWSTQWALSKGILCPLFRLSNTNTCTTCH